jgi:hypothetical protein
MYAVHNTNYVRALYALGYKGYTWQFDDGVGLLNCPASAAIGDPQQYTTYTITVCPNGAASNPAQPARWVFSPATGNCAASGPGGGTSYSSLALCQQANMRYACDDVTRYDPYQVPNALWRADVQATRNGRHRRHAAAVHLLLWRRQFPLSGVAAGRLTMSAK